MTTTAPQTNKSTVTSKSSRLSIGGGILLAGAFLALAILQIAIWVMDYLITIHGGFHTRPNAQVAMGVACVLPLVILVVFIGAIINDYID